MMEDQIKGIHHLTAIAGNAQQNYDFYTRVLALRLLKKTVNFDDPHTYHLYYGDETGSPGSILTFFPYGQVNPGRPGPGMATEIAFSVPEGSLYFWRRRFEENKVLQHAPTEKYGQPSLRFLDPDGLALALIVPKNKDPRKAWTTSDIGEEQALRGFHHVTLSLQRSKHTAAILTEIFGYTLEEEEENRSLYKTEAIDTANRVELLETKNEKPGLVAGGTVHHVAFRVKDEDTLMRYREKILQKGFLNITEKIDRNYFYSLYFREPGGVLFELATDNPGFTIDEAPDQLGSELKLPPRYEAMREKIEKRLPQLI